MADETVEILLQIRSDLEGITEAREETEDFMSQLIDIGSIFSAGLGFGAGVASVEGLAGAFGEALTAGVKYNASLEQQTVAFETLLGSQDQAVDRLNQLQEFSAYTPFEMSEVVEANRLLQVLTDGALATEDGMRLAGDAAAAAGRDFVETSMWIGRLYSGLNSGLPIGEATMRLTEMGLVSGETRMELERLAKDGALGAAGAIQALENAFGSTAGAMEKQSQTFNGLLSTVKDNLLIITAELAKPQFEGLKIALEFIGQQMGAIDTAEQKRVNSIEAQTKALQDQVQAMASITDQEKTLADLRAAQEMAQSRISSISHNRATLIGLRDEASRSGQPTDTITADINISTAEIEAYQEQIRTIQKELSVFGETQITRSVSEIDTQIERMRMHLSTVNEAIAEERTRTYGAGGVAPASVMDESQRRINNFETNKSRIESQIEILNNERKITDAIESQSEAVSLTAQQIIERNVSERKSLELEQARTTALRESQDWLSKNKEEIEESLEQSRFEKLELSEQLSLLQARKTQVDEEFQSRISQTENVTVIERLNLELQSEQLSIAKEIEYVESKILKQKEAQAKHQAEISRESTRQFLRAQERQIQARQQNITQARTVVSSDFRATSFEKRQIEIELVRNEIALQQEFIRTLQERYALETESSTRETISQRIDQASNTLNTTQTELFTLEAQPDPFSYADQFDAEITRMRESWGTFAQQSAQAWSSAINGAINTASGELTNAILITGEWQEALMSIPRVITTEIVNAIIQMGLRWIATQAMMALFGKSLQASMIAATAPMAAASSAIWSAPATLATIATGGGAAAAAPAAIAGSIASTTGLSLVGFQSGGFTGHGSDDEEAGIVHKNEVVIPAPIVRRMGIEPLEKIVRGEITRDDLMDGFREGGFTGDLIERNRLLSPGNIPAPSFQQTFQSTGIDETAQNFSPNFSPQINVGAPQVVVVDSKDRLIRMIEENPELQDAIVATLDRRRN